jgi:hypothetical protein
MKLKRAEEHFYFSLFSFLIIFLFSYFFFLSFIFSLFNIFFILHICSSELLSNIVLAIAVLPMLK